MARMISPARRVKARKGHRCDWCGKAIVPGEEHTATPVAGDGCVYTWRECGRCAPYVGEMLDCEGLDDDCEYSVDSMIEYMRAAHPDVLAEWEEADRGR